MTNQQYVHSPNWKCLCTHCTHGIAGNATIMLTKLQRLKFATLICHSIIGFDSYSTCFCILWYVIQCRTSVKMHYNIHYTVHSTVHYTVHSTIHYTVHSTVHYTVHCTIHYTVHCTIHYTVHCTVHYTVVIVRGVIN